MRSLIDRRRSELKSFGELKSETKWNGLKKLCEGISGGAKRHTRTVINVAAGILVGVVIGWYAHDLKAHAAYAKDLAEWRKELEAWKAIPDQGGKTNVRPISYAEKTTSAATSAP